MDFKSMIIICFKGWVLENSKFGLSNITVAHGIGHWFEFFRCGTLRVKCAVI